MSQHYLEELEKSISQINIGESDLVLHFKPQIWMHVGLIQAICIKYDVPISKIVEVKYGYFSKYAKSITVRNLFPRKEE